MKRFTSLAILLVVAAVPPSLSGDRASSESFDLPIRLSVMSVNEVEANDSRTILLPDGRMIFAWPDGLEGSRDILARTSLDAGRTWTEPINISGDPGDAFEAELTRAGMTLYLAYRQQEGPEPEIRFTRSEDGGVTWSIPIKVSGDGGGSDPDIAARGDNTVVITWRIPTGPGDGSAVVRSSQDGGDSWGDAVTLQADGVAGTKVESASDRFVAMFWGAGQLHMASDTGSFSNPAVTTFDINGFGGNMLYEGGVMHVYGSGVLDGGFNIVETFSVDKGQAWSPLIDVTGLGLGAGVGTPVAAARGGRIVLVWSQIASLEARPFINSGSVTPPDGEVSPLIALSNLQNDAFDPSIAINGSVPYVVWTEISPSDPDTPLARGCVCGDLDRSQSVDLQDLQYVADSYGGSARKLNIGLGPSAVGLPQLSGGAAAERSPHFYLTFLGIDPSGDADLFFSPGYITGDANCTADVTAVDALMGLREVAGIGPPAACIGAADVNCDGAITAVDSLLMLRHVADLPVNRPEGCSPIGV